MLLTRAIHHLWTSRGKCLGGVHRIELEAFDATLETLFGAKRQVKAEIRDKAAESFRKWRASQRSTSKPILASAKARDRLLVDFNVTGSNKPADRLTSCQFLVTQNQ